MEFLHLLTWVCIFGLAYHYLGYPIVVFVASRLAPYHVRCGATHPEVSLIIAAYNEAAVIKQKLDNTLELDYPRELLQIIVVTDGSSDETADIVASYKDRGIILMHRPERAGKSAAINRAAERASGQILLFSDANAFYQQDALRNLVRNFHDESVGCVSGMKTVQSTSASITGSEGSYWKYESFIKICESQLGTTTAVVGEMMALRRAAFSPIPAGIINDDAYLAHHTLHSGYRVIYEPKAICWETSAQKMRDEVIRRRRINAGRFQLFFRFSLWPWNRPLVLFSLLSHKYLRLFLPVLMAGALAGNAASVILAPQAQLLRWTLLAQLVAYALAIIGWLGERRKLSWKLPALSYYVIRASLTPLEGLWGFLRRTQTTLWEKPDRGRLA